MKADRTPYGQPHSLPPILTLTGMQHCCQNIDLKEIQLFKLLFILRTVLQSILSMFSLTTCLTFSNTHPYMEISNSQTAAAIWEAPGALVINILGSNKKKGWYSHYMWQHSVFWIYVKEESGNEGYRFMYEFPYILFWYLWDIKYWPVVIHS